MGRPVFLELLEPFRVEEVLLDAAALEQDALVGLDDETFLVKSRLVRNELLKFLLGTPMDLAPIIFDVLLDGIDVDPPLQLH